MVKDKSETKRNGTGHLNNQTLAEESRDNLEKWLTWALSNFEFGETNKWEWQPGQERVSSQAPSSTWFCRGILQCQLELRVSSLEVKAAWFSHTTVSYLFTAHNLDKPTSRHTELHISVKNALASSGMAS